MYATCIVFLQGVILPPSNSQHQVHVFLFKKIPLFTYNSHLLLGGVPVSMFKKNLFLVTLLQEDSEEKLVKRVTDFTSAVNPPHSPKIQFWRSFVVKQTTARSGSKVPTLRVSVCHAWRHGHLEIPLRSMRDKIVGVFKLKTRAKT